jgi:hypothetical protein
MTAQLGTPRGRYDENSSKSSLSMKPSDEGMPNGLSIFAYLVFGPEGTSAEEIARLVKLVIWRSPGARLGVQCKT